MKVSKYLTYKEVTKSYTAIRKGIDNTPSKEQLKNIKIWANMIFDPIREFIGAALGCSTIFRSKNLNAEIGGVWDSQHICDNGCAGDIDSDIYNNSTNEIIFNFIRRNLDFDQLIAEELINGEIAWVHCSYVSPDKNRNEILMMYNKDGIKHYEYYSKERFEELINRVKIKNHD